MPTVHRFGNLRFVIFANDHGPPHVHVFAPSGEAKLLLASDGGPSMVWARDIDRATLRRAFPEAIKRRAMLMEAWQRLHGPYEQE
jgi:hypothetical protein